MLKNISQMNIEQQESNKMRNTLIIFLGLIMVFFIGFSNLHSKAVCLKDHITYLEIKNFTQRVNENKKIPSIVWLFDSTEQMSLYDKLARNNILQYAKNDNYQINIVNHTSCLNHLNHGRQQQLRDFLHKKQVQANQQILQRVILLHLIDQNGGIAIQNSVFLTQSLEWLHNLQSNEFINKKKEDQYHPNFFAFYQIKQSSNGLQNQKTNSKQSNQDYFFVQYPALEGFFMASVPGCLYTKQLLFKYMEEYLSSFFTNNLFNSVSRRIIEERSMSLIDKSALSFYGIYTINSLYFPKKHTKYFEYDYFDKMYNYMAVLSQEQMKLSTGPFRFVVLLSPQAIQYFGKRLSGITEKSFLWKHLLLQKSNTNTPKNDQFDSPKSGKTWNSLPKIVWMYWDSGMMTSSAGNILCYYNTLKAAEQSHFQVRLVDETNINQYLEQQTIDKINRIYRESVFRLQAQHRSDLIRIALMIKHGGIYLDSSYFFVQNLDWIVEISDYPSKLVFNRFGDIPKILFLFNPYYKNPFTFEYDKNHNTKVGWQLAYENNFIVAEPNSQFLITWFDTFESYLTSYYEQTIDKMKECGTYEHRWNTYKSNRYLTAMDSMKSVFGCTQRKIDDGQIKGFRNANHYYGAWAINGFTGQQKFRGFTNFDYPFSDFNYFMYFRSIEYSENVIGKVDKLSKLYSISMAEINKFLKENYKNVDILVHPDSYFKKYLFNTKELEFYESEGKILVKEKDGEKVKEAIQQI